jgi:hypothetical protein
VPREGEQVDLHAADVDGQGAGRLRRIDAKDDPVLPGDPADFGHGHDRPRDVGGVRQNDRLRVRADRRPDVAGLQFAGAGTGNDRQGDARLFEGAQGAHHGIVLHAGRDDVVAGLQQAEDRDVQGLRRVFRQHDAEGIADAEQAGQDFPGREDLPGRRDGQPMAGTPGVRPNGLHETAHGQQGLRGLRVRRGGIVDVNDVPAHPIIFLPAARCARCDENKGTNGQKSNAFFRWTAVRYRDSA